MSLRPAWRFTSERYERKRLFPNVNERTLLLCQYLTKQQLPNSYTLSRPLDWHLSLKGTQLISESLEALPTRNSQRRTVEPSRLVVYKEEKLPIKSFFLALGQDLQSFLLL